MSRFRQLERAKRDAQAEANRHGHDFDILDVLGSYWVRPVHKREHILSRYPRAEYVCTVKPQGLFGDGASC